MNTFNILIIGNEDFINKINLQLQNNLDIDFNVEKISNQKAALKRLYHNSYDLLLLQNNFSKYNTLDLTKMAYAMSRPTIIICNSIFSILKYKLWSLFSYFSRTQSCAKYLIFYKSQNVTYFDLLKHLVTDHVKYLETINRQIKLQFDKL